MNKNLYVLIVAGVTAVMAIVPTITGEAQRASARVDPSTVVKPALSPKVLLGQLGYTAYCAKCHGKNLAGSDNGPTFLSRVYHPGHHGDAAFYAAAKQGTRAHHWQFGDMPPVEGVTDAQMQDIIAYIRAVQKANGVF